MAAHDPDITKPGFYRVYPDGHLTRLSRERYDALLEDDQHERRRLLRVDPLNPEDIAQYQIWPLCVCGADMVAIEKGNDGGQFECSRCGESRRFLYRAAPKTKCEIWIGPKWVGVVVDGHTRWATRISLQPDQIHPTKQATQQATLRAFKAAEEAGYEVVCTLHNHGDPPMRRNE